MKKIVAIEVTSDYVRAVELENPLTNKPKMIKFGEIALPQGAAGESEIFETDVVKDAIQELWKIQKFSTKQVALGLGGRKILVRDYETPVAEIGKIRANLKFEAANLLPPQMGNAVLDFYPAGLKISETKLELVHGLLIAAPSEPAEKIIAVLKSAGLDVQIVDFLPFGIARVARKAFGTDGEYLLVNVKSYSTDIIGMKNGIPQMIRMIPNGLIVRADQGGKHRGVADAAASFAGGESAPADPIDSIISGLRNTVSYYGNKGGNPGAILLAGEGSLSKELQERLPQALKLRTGLLNLENAIEVPKKSNDDPIAKAALLSILGVGMRGLTR